jgi:cytochrome c oxidase subunit IV
MNILGIPKYTINMLLGVRALICIMSGLSIVVAYVGWQFLRLGNLLLLLLVLEISRRFILGQGHSPLPR